MFFFITLHSITGHAYQDNPHDLFDKSAELYQTWLLTELEDATDVNSAATWGRQGFSVRNAPSGAGSFRKPKRGAPIRTKVIDPQITFSLPDDLTSALFRFDTHYWESDRGGSTEKIRSLFSDSTLKYMTAAWAAANEDANKAKQSLETWIDNNWQDIATNLVGMASPAAAGIVSKFNVLELGEAIVRCAMTGADDYHQMLRFVFQLKKTGNSGPSWRIITPSNSSGTEWTSGYGTQTVVETVTADGGATKYDVEWRFRVLES